MDRHRLQAGHLVALVGAAVALLSLWRPWYVADLEAALRPISGGGGAQVPLPGFDEFLRGLAAFMPKKIEASGWLALRGADVALCVGAVVVAGLVLGVAGAFGSAVRVEGPTAGRWIATLGVAGVLLCLWHVIKLPLDADVVKVAHGLWLALGACGATAIGGALTARAPRPDAPAATIVRFDAPEADVGADRAASVPPPATR